MILLIVKQVYSMRSHFGTCIMRGVYGLSRDTKTVFKLIFLGGYGLRVQNNEYYILEILVMFR